MDSPCARIKLSGADANAALDKCAIRREYAFGPDPKAHILARLDRSRSPRASDVEVGARAPRASSGECALELRMRGSDV